MDYVVWPAPNVTARLSKEPREIQDRFQHVASVLMMNPYPNPQFPLLTEERSRGGRTIYTFADPVYPFSFQYLIYEPVDAERLGWIAIIRFIKRRST